MSIMVDGIGLPRNGCIGCYFRTAKYCGLKESNDYVWNYAEKGTRPDDCPITELIRCKDCAHYQESYVGPFYECDLDDSYREENDYCSNAKGKEE